MKVKKSYVGKVEMGIALFLSLLISSSAFAGDFIASCTELNEAWWSTQNYVYYTPISHDGTASGRVTVDYFGTTNSRNRGIGVADFDNDGKKDIVFALGYNETIYFYSNPESGSAVRETVGTYNADNGSGGGKGSEEIAVADFNNDGNKDFLLSGFNNELQVFMGDGTGGFTKLATQYLSIPGVQGNGMIRGKDTVDYDGDGITDLITAYRYGDYLGDNIICVWIGNGDGTFVSPTSGSILYYKNGNGLNPSCNMFGKVLVVDDYNCDYIPDILFTAETSQDVADFYLMAGTCNGFAAPGLFVQTSINKGCLAGDRYTSFNTQDSRADVFYSRAQVWNVYTNFSELVSNANCGLTNTSMFGWGRTIGGVATPR